MKYTEGGHKLPQAKMIFLPLKTLAVTIRPVVLLMLGTRPGMGHIWELRNLSLLDLLYLFP
jgi:hypothetical protein